VTLPIGVDPALLGMSAGVENAGAASMAAAAGAAAPEIIAVLPPGADAVSAAAAAALNARGAATTAAMSEFIAMRGLFADTMGVSGVSYAATETANTIASTI
jgi:hypothetical protein